MPSPPNLKFDNVTDSQFTLMWDPPNILPGNLEEFEMTIKWEPLYPIPNWCTHEPKNENIKYNVSGNIFDYTYLEAKAYTMYIVCMRAKTGAGWSECGTPQNIKTNSIGIYYFHLFVITKNYYLSKYYNILSSLFLYISNILCLLF